MPLQKVSEGRNYLEEDLQVIPKSMEITKSGRSMFVVVERIREGITQTKDVRGSEKHFESNRKLRCK